MTERPKTIYALILLWLSLSGIFVIWGVYSLVLLIQIPSWRSDTVVAPLVPILLFGYLISTIVWLVFSALFVIFAYATFRKESWAWTTGIIFSTIFLAIFGIMLASFIVNALMFFDWFTRFGLITVVLSFIGDLGIIFYLTRPVTKRYFEII